MSGPRFYCRRVGGAVTFGAVDECPECGDPRATHPQIRDGECGAYVTCPVLSGHGHGCDLPAGHAGEHRAAPHSGFPRGPRP